LVVVGSGRISAYPQRSSKRHPCYILPSSLTEAEGHLKDIFEVISKRSLSYLRGYLIGISERGVSPSKGD
jgi:hypothetical protein